MLVKKEFTTNRYSDAWINKNNQLVISDCVFECDLTQLLPNSIVDEQGYLVDTATGVKYDLNDADVIADIGLNDISIFDESDDNDIDNVGEIISIVYKGDHYQVIVRTKEEEDFVLNTTYNWNENDIVNIQVDKKDIKLTLKGNVKKYEVD